VSTAGDKLPALRRKKAQVPAAAVASSGQSDNPAAAYEYPDPDAGIIGQGATGDHADIPECPLCRAHGGGGHGSNCLNTGKDPADWISELPDGWTGPERSTA